MTLTIPLEIPDWLMNTFAIIGFLYIAHLVLSSLYHKFFHGHWHR